MKKSLLWSGFALFACGLLLLGWNTSVPANQAQAEDKAPAGKKLDVTPQAVETDMHEFMEYMFEPPYKRLKAVLATEELDKAAFKGVKSDGLILAEGGNLLLDRLPEEHAGAWQEHAVAVREQGAVLYQAGKAKDAVAARKAFGALLLKCNACHNQFAEGEHQLSP